VAGSYAVNYAVKVTVRRRRPELPGLPPITPTVSRLSSPSHATTSFAACRAYGELVPSGLLYAAAGQFALSRPHLGVDYPSDVAAGMILGTAIGEAWPR
jgi:undecaprenyl-diphosphatase